jgi:ABC-type amino acid transport system permease subunit
MSTTPEEMKIEPGWKTYATAAVFSLPALIFWAFGLIILLPNVKAALELGGVDFSNSNLGWLWRNPLFLADYRDFILIAILVLLVSLELLSRSWASWRRATVGILVWLLNIAVLYGLTLLVLSTLLAVSGLAHAK